MTEFLTRYPRRVGFMEGFHDFILNEEIQFDHLSLMVKIKKDELINTLLLEGFKRVKFENRKPSQIGNGFAKMLFKPWEIHVRLLDLQQQGLIAIQAEVEISRKYIQHIRSVRAPVIYEIETILKRHKIEYKIWNAKVRDYITSIVDNHQIKLHTPKIPAMRWRLMIIYGAIILAFNAMKLFGII
ncbi:MAG: hypothetical protein WAM54_06050 [Nitrososphaeraceae archaeon]|jgi:hypothetical protein